MTVYADTSFLARVYTPHDNSEWALRWMQRAVDPLPFTPLHRHELRNSIRLRTFRKEISAEQRQEAFRCIDADLEENVLVHHAIPWTEAFREAEMLAAAHTETLGVRGIDLLHVGIARALGRTEFLTCDERQAVLARAAGFRVKP